jgi:hypothetical protein
VDYPEMPANDCPTIGRERGKTNVRKDEIRHRQAEYLLPISSNHGAVNLAILDGPPRLVAAPLLVPIKFDHAPTVLS